MHIFCEKKIQLFFCCSYLLSAGSYFFCQWLSAQTVPGVGYINEYELFYVTFALIDSLKSGSW